MPNWSIALIPLLPLLAVLWIAIGFIAGWNRHEKGEKETARVSLIAITASFFLLIFADISALNGHLASEVSVGTWLKTGDYHIKINFLLDHLALTMATLISFISLLVTKFSINYLHREAGFQRFFMLLSLFNAAMLLIVLAGNAVLTFIAWELAGVSSFLLIAYSWHRDVATNNAMRAFITNRIGDAGFIMAIAFSFFWLGTVDWTEQFAVIEKGEVSQIFVGLILWGFIIAASAKSAQLPFSAWISRALEGPTPSSAVFYGALMVHAGVYLLLRLQPILEYVPVLMLIILLVGGATAIYGYLVGLVQTDVKSSFMFSTLSQVGLMLVWIGNGWFDFALIHLVLHAIWRTYQFLHAPSFLQQVTRPSRPVPAWLQKQDWLYTATLQRFWLDGISDWLLTKPTCTLAHEAQIFDEKVVDRLTGIQSHSNVISSLSRWEAQKKGQFVVKDNIGTANGLFGFLMQHAASALYWFEERLILKGSGEGLLKLIHSLGRYLENIDKLLMQPRYLLVLVMATFVVIL
jgi:NADH:ubiquinone oxidoreductase subunit 5 (subunit L)/multisubunit Na+/H+ antiporter MnhA subunit